MISNFISLLKNSWKDLTANKLRSFLTMLGIIIGIASVILVIAIGAGAQQLIVSQVSKIGTNLVGVLPGESDETGIPASAFGMTITSLKRADATAIGNIPHVEAVTPYVNGRDSVSFEAENQMYDYVGVNSDYINVEQTNLEKGRFFRKDDIESYSRVAVLGNKVEEELSKEIDPIGKKISIGSQKFTVIGVLEKRGSTLFGQLDSQIFVPVTTAQKRLLGIDYINYLRAKVDKAENEGRVREEITILLRHCHNITDEGKDDFSVRSMSQLLSILKGVTGAIQAFLILVVAISLIVGGIGIANVILSSVSNRIREIGLRKAIGAKDRDILIQFLIESGLLSFMGGVIGIILGVSFGYLISYLIRYFTGFEWYFVISLWQIAGAVLISILVGALAGVYPAYKASKLDPIDALHYE